MIVSNKVEEVLSNNILAIEAVKKCIASFDINSLQHGRKLILDNNVAVVEINAASGTANKNILEAHKAFNDLHYVLQGNDVIAYKHIDECKNINKEYTADGDYILYDDLPVHSVEIIKGTFCFIPNELAHAALYNDTGVVKKLVFKIPAQQ